MRCLNHHFFKAGENVFKGFQGAFNRKQNFFPKKHIASDCTYHFSEIKMELLTFLRRIKYIFFILKIPFSLFL